MHLKHLAILLLCVSCASASDTEVETLRAIEVERLKALVEAKMDIFEKYHSTEYQLISPAGLPFTFESYRDAIGSGKLDYLVFEADSAVVIRVHGTTAILRYQAKVEFAWDGQKQKPVKLWHTDYYEKKDGTWKVVWSQATQIW